MSHLHTLRRGLLALTLVSLAAPALSALTASDKLRSGPMLGYAEIDATVIWLQTRVPALAQARYWPQGHPEQARLSAVVETTAAGDLIARFPLANLAFGTRYDYELYLDGDRLQLDQTTSFQTQPMWRWRADPPSFRIALGSCAYVNDPPFDRPGMPYGSEYAIFGALAAQRPDLMLWLGDNVYFREADWLTEAGMRRRYAATRELPDLQSLLASTANYATWDDHDYGPNNSDRTFRGRDQSLSVFADYWPNPSYGTREIPGVFTRFEWGDVELFLLDDRFHRSADELPDGPGKTMWGKAQLAWLEDALLSSNATFKLVATGNQVLNPNARHETMARYANERDELLAFLARTKVPGVLLLSGDRHFTELMRLERPDGYPLYELTVSPLTAGLAGGQEVDNALRVPGTWVNDRHNFGLIDVSGPPAARLLTLRILDTQGTEIWRQEVSAAELQLGTRAEVKVLPATPLEVEDIDANPPAEPAPVSAEPVSPQAR
jgi:alkaline phosphatase D